MSRSTTIGKEAEDALIAGLNLVADAVQTTLGPSGKTVVIQRKDKSPLITKDGVSVAREISPKDEKLKLGADLATSIAKKQLSQAGDGTTTATVLGREIVRLGMAQLNLMDRTVNRTAFRRGIEKTRDALVNAIESMSKEIDSDEQLKQIATVSANGDSKLGEIIANAYTKVGKDGVVMVEECKDRNISLEFKEGMTFDRGWVSQYFANKEDGVTAEFDDARLLLVNNKFSNIHKLEELATAVISQGKALVIIADGFDEQIINTLVINKIRNGVKVCCIESPSFGENKLETLRDIAAYTGSNIADDPTGIKIDSVTVADLGICDKIVIKKDETIIRGGQGEKAKIDERIKTLNSMIAEYEDNPNDMHREWYTKRLARLTTGVAVIKVGGSSEEEIKELKDRLEDSQCAVRAALDGGYVPGAGNVLLTLSNREVISKNEFENDDELLGYTVLMKAIKAPFKAILDNAGVASEPIIKQILTKDDSNYGYDARKNEFANLLEKGIIDPTKVVTGSVYAASSIATTILTSNVIITEDPIENNGITLNAGPMLP